MVWGAGRAWGGDPRLGELDQSTPNQIALLFNDPEAKLNIVLECQPRRLGKAGEQNMSWGGVPGWGGAWLVPDQDKIGKRYLSTQGLVTEPDDTPANINMPAALSTGVNYQASIPVIGNQSDPESGFGVTEIVLGRDTDYLTNSAWAGTRVVIKIGGTTRGTVLKYREYETFLEGVAAGADFDEETLRVAIRDKAHHLLHTLQQNTYLGDGSSYEGDSSLKGKYKPRLFGDCFNVSGALVDKEDFIFQVNDGPIEAITACRDNGAALTFDTDTTDLPNWSGSTGQYATDLSRGLIRVWDEPDGDITADVQGDAEIDEGTSYTHKAALIIRGMLREKDIAYGGTSFGIHAQQAIGYYTDTSAKSYLSAINEIMSSLDGWMVQNRRGDMELGSHRDPLSDPDHVIEGRRDQNAPAAIASIERLPTPEPVYKLSIPYRRNWHTQSADGLDDSVSVEDRERYAAELRRTDHTTNNTVLGMFPDAIEYEPEQGGFLVNQSDAETIRSNISGRYSRHLGLWRLDITRPRMQVFVGDIVEFYHDRFGLSTGARGEVVSLHETDELTEIKVLATRLPQDTM